MEQQLTLESLRKRKCLSKYRLSKLSGLSAVYISQLEKGQKSPTERTLKRLATALEVDISELLKESEAASK